MLPQRQRMRCLPTAASSPIEYGPIHSRQHGNKRRIPSVARSWRRFIPVGNGHRTDGFGRCCLDGWRPFASRSLSDGLPSAQLPALVSSTRQHLKPAFHRHPVDGAETLLLGLDALHEPPDALHQVAAGCADGSQAHRHHESHSTAKVGRTEESAARRGLAPSRGLMPSMSDSRVVAPCRIVRL